MTTSEGETIPHLSRRTTLAYSFGQLGSGVYSAFNNFTLPLYLKLFTSNDILIGWLSSTRSFEQCLIQPLVGARSDRTWPRVGRRTPYFLTAMPIVAVLLILNGFIPRDPVFLWLVALVIFSFSLIYNIGIDPYYALMIDVTPEPHRGTVNGIAQLIGFMGNVLVLVVAALWWSAHPEWVFAFVAGSLLLGFGVVAAGVRERRELIQRQAHAAGPRRSPPEMARALGNYVRELWISHREAMKLLGVKILYEFGISAALPFLTLFIVNEIGVRGWPEMVRGIPGLADSGLAGLDAVGLSQLIAAFLLLSTALAAIPSGLLGDRFGKKPVFAAGLLIVGIFALLAAFATSVPQLLFFLLFVGLGNGARIVLFQPYLADLIPIERVGEFTGLTAFAETGGVFLAIIVAGALIDLNAFNLHYRLVFVLTGVFLIIGFVAVFFVKSRLEPVEPAIEFAPGGPLR